MGVTSIKQNGGPRIFKSTEQTRQAYGNSADKTRNETRIGTSVGASVSSSSGLGVGDRGPKVQQAQQALDEAGHSPGAIDGHFGENTQAAAQDFQQERIDSVQQTLDNGPPPAARGVLQQRINDLESELELGVIGDETQAQLAQVSRDEEIIGARTTEIGEGDSGTAVLVAQQNLADADFSPGVIDGEFGPNTLEAAQDFQQDRIDSIQRTLDGGVPGPARSVLASRISDLRDEMEQGVIGEATQAQFDQIDRDGLIIDGPVELGVGSRGGNVVSLQEDLVDAGYFPGVADGLYGPKTSAATNDFQQDRIDSLESSIAGGPPPAGRSVLQEQLNNLTEEQASGIAGAETQLQLQQTLDQLAPKEESEAAPGADGPAADKPEENADPAKLDFPGFENIEDVAQSLLDGDLDEALESALNSEGDTVSLNLGATARAPLGVVSFNGEINADITRTADGYELSFGTDVAVGVGLAADSDAASIDAQLGVGAKAKFNYDTLEEAQQGAKDLLLTAGRFSGAGAIVAAIDGADAVKDRLTGKVNAALDALPLGTGDLARKAIGNVDDYVLEALDSLPESLEVKIDPLGRFGPAVTVGLEIPALASDLRDFKNFTEDKLALVEDISEQQEGARGRLESAYDSVEGTLSAKAILELGIPGPFQLQNFGLGLEAGRGVEATATYDKDGNLSVSFGLVADGAVRGGFAVGGEISGEAHVDLIQKYVKGPEGGFVTDGDLEAVFSADAEALARVGTGVAFDTGVGGELSFTTNASELGDKLVDTVEAFLQEDIDAALETLGGIEGEIEITSRAVGGAAFHFGADFEGAELSVNGRVEVQDRGETFVDENLTLDEAFDFLNESVEDLIEEQEVQHA